MEKPVEGLGGIAEAYALLMTPSINIDHRYVRCKRDGRRKRRRRERKKNL